MIISYQAPIHIQISGRSTIGIAEFRNDQTLLESTIVVAVEPHDGVASNAEISEAVTPHLAVRVSLNLLLHRNGPGVVIQAEDGDARYQNL
jgi:hypothetical protein